MSEWGRNSALHDTNGQLQAFSNDAIHLRPRPDLSKLKLQCRPDAEIDFTALERAVGSKIPRSPKETTGSNPSIFWLAPNEWLITSTYMDKQTFYLKLADIVSDQTHGIADLSDDLAVIELSGEKSKDLLSEGCGLDLYPSSFQTGRYASTRLFQLSAIIHRIGKELCFRIYVDRSIALHLWNWFVGGAKQFG